MGVKQINQSTLDHFFPSYNFSLGINSKASFIAVLDKTLETATFKDDNVRRDLLSQRDQLEKIEEDLVLKRTMEHFNYEFVFKEDTNLKGFVKITHRTNPKHRGLLEWRNNNDPILYLAEYDNSHMRLHINYGEEGLAIVEEASELSWRWTHCLQEGYLDIAHNERGSILMSKLTKAIKLEDGNLAALEASKKATAIQGNNKTLLENNIALMKIYEKQLRAI